MKNKIGWCNLTFNPAIGCKNNCEYCYGRAMNKRFGFIKNWDNLEWKESNFNKKFPKKPQKIFVGSMSEIKYWKNEWVEMILEKIRKYPQHIFQFLTKFPGVYLWYKFPENCWLGITITDTKNYDYIEYQKFKISNPDNLKFISFEPLLNEISIDLENINWVILGAETGGRKDKVFAKRCWIESILINCYKKGIPVYIKESIIKWQPQLKRFKEFPGGK